LRRIDIFIVDFVSGIRNPEPSLATANIFYDKLDYLADHPSKAIIKGCQVTRPCILFWPSKKNFSNLA
jgi:hypothetical protein